MEENDAYTRVDTPFGEVGLLAPLAADVALLPAPAGIAQHRGSDVVENVLRHTDAGYEDAVACAREHGLDLPFLGGV